MSASDEKELSQYTTNIRRLNEEPDVCTTLIPVILHVAYALAAFGHPVAYPSKLLEFIRLPPSCNANYLGYNGR